MVCFILLITRYFPLLLIKSTLFIFIFNWLMRAMNAKTSLPDVLLRAVLELPRVDNVNILFRVKYLKKNFFFWKHSI